ncbi:hypothetical protein ACFL47_02635 [Candidatus Latescibacterota bacterium]
MKILICDHTCSGDWTDLQKTLREVLIDMQKGNSSIEFECYGALHLENGKKALKVKIRSEKPDIVFSHYGGTGRFVFGDMDSIPVGTTMVYTSSVGRDDPHITNGVVRRIFIRTRFGEIDKKTWNDIFECLVQGDANNIAIGKCPEKIKKYFEFHTTLKALPSLCILCQGFLGVWRELEPGAEGLVMGDIGQALELMCWNEVPSEIRDGVRERLVGPSSVSSDEKEEPSYDDIYKLSWWQVFEDNNQEALVAQVKNELNIYNVNNKVSYKMVLPLVKFLSGVMNTTRSEIPIMAAKAYIAIHGIRAFMIVNTVISQAWQKRRSDFNHDWLQNNFIVTLSDWNRNIQKGKWHLISNQLFEQEIVDPWNTSDDQIPALLLDYTEYMSPRTFLVDSDHIKNMTPGWQHIIGDMMHSLWLVRYDVLARIKEVSDANTASNQAFDTLKSAFANALEKQDTELLLRLFDEFKGHCLALRQALSPLESSIRITCEVTNEST